MMSSWKLCERICEALGIPMGIVSRITLDIDATNSLPSLTIEVINDLAEIQNWKELLKGMEVTVKVEYPKIPYKVSDLQGDEWGQKLFPYELNLHNEDTVYVSVKRGE